MTRGSTAPGPDSARTFLGPIGSPQTEQLSTASATWPHGSWTTSSGRSVGGGVGVAPLAHGREDRPQVPALLGQPVVVAGRVVAVGDLGQYPGLDQVGQALVQDVAGDPEAFVELVEPGHPEERVADDQHRPPLADHLETLGHRAVHVREALPFHQPRLVSCIIGCNPLQ